MTDMMSGVENAEDSKTQTCLDGLDEQLVAELVSRTKAGVPPGSRYRATMRAERH